MSIYMDSLTELWKRTAVDLAVRCHTSATLDIKKVESRIKQEGFSFLTITLPAFAKDFERCLEQGCVDSIAFPGFARKRGLPLFLGGFLSHVFDSSSGSLVDDHENDLLIDSIFAVRQLCYLFAKIEIPCSKARVSRAIRGYIDCERELSEKEDDISEEDLEDFRRISSLVFRGVFSIMDSKILDGELRGRHGPGSTADKLTGNRKFDQTEWTTRLEEVFPAREHLFANERLWFNDHNLDRVQFLEPETERPVRVITVPKTLKTPRIIAIEPTCMQYMQQALLEPLVEVLELQFPRHRDEENLSSYFLGFSHQNPNRDLARQGSRSGDLATLDLSEASDRVLNKLVIELLHNNPLFSEAVQATRSTTACVPSPLGDINLPLTKFASMGSALCFPFEAMIFLVAILRGIEQSTQRPLTRKFVKSLRGSVRIYGDDLIVPVEHVKHVIDSLELFGFKINVNKSFWTGKFRESCGGDYYAGQDVTPVKVRKVFPKSRADAGEVISLVSLRNQMYHLGLWETTRWLDEKIGKFLSHFPIVQSTSPALGRESIVFTYLHGSDNRYCDVHHTPKVKGYSVRTRPPRSHVSGEGALLKFFLKRGVEPYADKEHLERQGRSQSTALQLRWLQPF